MKEGGRAGVFRAGCIEGAIFKLYIGKHKKSLEKGIFKVNGSGSISGMSLVGNCIWLGVAGWG